MPALLEQQTFKKSKPRVSPKRRERIAQLQAERTSSDFKTLAIQLKFAIAQAHSVGPNDLDADFFTVFVTPPFTGATFRLHSIQD